jgi:hypothetical protein
MTVSSVSDPNTPDVRFSSLLDNTAILSAESQPSTDEAGSKSSNDLFSSLDSLRLEREKRRIEYIAADLALRKLEASLKQVSHLLTTALYIS